MTVPALPANSDLKRRLSGSPLLVLLDVDGTLSPIAPRPDEATVAEETLAVLENLASLPRVQVAAVSGRGAADALRLVGAHRLWALGNHGMERISPEGEMSVDESVAPYLSAISEVAARLQPLVASMDGVILENKRVTLSVHYRLASPGVVPRLESAVTQAAADCLLLVTHGKQVLEIRPPVHVNKGTATVELARELGALGDHASLLFAGDDRTDEDAFEQLRKAKRDAVTVRVVLDEHADATPTAAEFRVADPDAVRELLAWLAVLRHELQS